MKKDKADHDLRDDCATTMRQREQAGYGSRSQQANRNGPGEGASGTFFFFFSGGGEAGWGRQGRTCVCAISHEAKRDSRKLKRKQDGGREAVVLKEREYV